MNHLSGGKESHSERAFSYTSIEAALVGRDLSADGPHPAQRPSGPRSCTTIRAWVIQETFSCGPMARACIKVLTVSKGCKRVQVISEAAPPDKAVDNPLFGSVSRSCPYVPR
mmetsp:Transcript_70039/g.126219  ORF Transcript_70039/g.126219 Transcript_70039/m.126219 type:complete len:112 (-) Transcript_70039:713-1048(-)